jgi:hypothetical protein
VTEADDSQAESDRPETDWQRRRRLAEIFGDVLPDTTSDERDPSERGPEQERGDTWLKEQVPPHHGG